MRGLFSLCLCIFLINQLLFEKAIAPATCPGGYKTNKACTGIVGGDNHKDCKDYLGPDRVNGLIVKYKYCRQIIVNGRGSLWCCPP
uniref:Candidate secreted effector n=1 Tax=Meloidogyne incognita TaxID=6306 RepID=A0A914KGB9_MELIC